MAYSFERWLLKWWFCVYRYVLIYVGCVLQGEIIGQRSNLFCPLLNWLPNILNIIYETCNNTGKYLGYKVIWTEFNAKFNIKIDLYFRKPFEYLRNIIFEN